MKRLFMFLIILSLCSVSQAALTYGGTYYINHKQMSLSGSKSSDPIYLFMDEVEDLLGGGGYVQLTPGSEPTGVEGLLYYDNDANGLKIYNGSAWQTLDVAGGTSLDQSYDLGSSITVDGAAVTLTAGAGTSNGVLTLIQSNTGAYEGLKITNAGTDPSIEIDGTGTGDDITGTGDLWTVSEAGIGTFAGLIVGGTDIVMENGDKIENSTDDYFIFNTNDKEDLTIDLSQTNIVALASTTSAVSFDFGDFDTVYGMTAITGEASDFTISTTGNATGEDLIISQDGSGDNQVIIQSSGTAANAIAIQSSKGIDIDSVDDMAITNTATTNGDDLVITQAGAQDASLILTSGGTGTDALSLITSYSSGDIKINSGDMLDIDAADQITIDCAGTAGEDIKITNTGGSINVIATEDNAGAILIEEDGGTSGAITIHADQGASVTEGAYSIEMLSDAGGVEMRSASNLAKSVALTSDGGTTGSIWIFNDQGASVTEGGASIEILSDAGGVELRSTANLANAISLTSDGGTTGTIQIYNDQGTSTTEKAASIQLLSDSGSIELWSGLNGADAINIMADGSTASGITIFNDTGTGDESILLSSDVGGITLNAAAGSVDIEAVGAEDGDIGINAGDDMTLTAAGNLTLAITGTVSAGGSAITYQKAWIEEITADEAVAATDSGKTFVVLGDADGACVCTLPTAAAGLTFTFIDANSTAAADLWITANTGDKINGGTAAKSYVAQDDSIQSSVTIVAIDAENWVVTAQFGEEWANDNN